MSEYKFYDEDYEINELKKDSVIVGSMITIAVVSGIALPVGLISCINSATHINWDSIKKSSIIITQDDKLTNYHIFNSQNLK